MTSQRFIADPATVAAYIGQTVLMELVWEEDPDPIWRFFHILGVVVPMAGLYEHGHFMVLNALREERYPNEVFWSNIRTFIPLQHSRDHSGPVIPKLIGLIPSGAALPARRNSSTVAKNGSTGAAHP